MKRPATSRPEHPDGRKYEFNCCHSPDVQIRMPAPESSEKEVARCETCGEDWTEELGVNE